MFTGIITDVGRVRRIRREPGPDGGLELTIATSYDTATIALGASICCSGVCLTVVAVEPTAFAVQASAETLARSSLGEWQEGSPVNLERALRLGDELGGHLVSGHVDGLGEAISGIPENASTRWRFRVPDELARFIAAKGIVAVDGASLTVNDVQGSTFGVNIIPHTASVTTFGTLAPGDAVNIEIDTLARYVGRLAEFA